MYKELTSILKSNMVMGCKKSQNDYNSRDNKLKKQERIMFYLEKALTENEISKFTAFTKKIGSNPQKLCNITMTQSHRCYSIDIVALDAILKPGKNESLSDATERHNIREIIHKLL